MHWRVLEENVMIFQNYFGSITEKRDSISILIRVVESKDQVLCNSLHMTKIEKTRNELKYCCVIFIYV